MTTSPATSLLDVRVERFEIELREAAWSIVRAVVTDEIARRRQQTRRRPRGVPRAQLALPLVDRSIELTEAPIAAVAAVEAATPASLNVVEASALVETSGTVQPTSVVNTERQDDRPRGRRPWTRERVVDELANWILTMPGVDAASIGRRGGAALVNAARKEFGRFDAALNAANVALARRFPAGVPKPGHPTAS